MAAEAAKPSAMQRLLDTVERVGNAVPHPVVIFVILIVAVILLSALLALLGARVSYDVYDVETGQIVRAATEARSLLTIDGIRFMYTGVVGNFMSFQAVGVIIVAMVGVGVAEESGLIKALIRKLVASSPAWSLSYILTLVGILSSIAADAGYLVVIPLAAAAFYSVGRHPLAGLALGFASVASAFMVNFLVVPVDGILVGITNDAIALVDRNRSVGLLSNQWYEMASVILLTVLIAQLTERVIEPRLGAYTGDYSLPEDVEDEAEVEARGLRWALWGFLGAVAFIALITLPPGAPLRDPVSGDIIGTTPFMQSLIVSIALIFVAAGGAYGYGAGTLADSAAVVGAMQKALGSLSGLILLLLVISQFLAFFNYSNMATLAAVSLADVLTELNLDALWLLIGFIIVVFILDLVITGAIPKWAIFAPIFVPLLMRLGVEPDAVLAAYRTGDSPMNAITPLNAYFALIVTFAQRYQKESGVGTVIALMLPYIAALCVVWTVFFALWHVFGLPWGI
ncbi:AbgT family transporter [Elioraea rosea]|uniref:AbgT family transporter n=1 Tax=Elioraea rosea TaxID=2492390 RepID=UPI0011820290|nr:AbgT family transporter [Elioraea rosea]